MPCAAATSRYKPPLPLSLDGPLGKSKRGNSRTSLRKNALRWRVNQQQLANSPCGLEGIPRSNTAHCPCRCLVVPRPICETPPPPFANWVRLAYSRLLRIMSLPSLQGCCACAPDSSGLAESLEAGCACHAPPGWIWIWHSTHATFPEDSLEP